MVYRYKGPLRAWRIADKRHVIYDGTGASHWGARWNSPGRRVIYASTSYSCAMLEMLAHAGIGRVPAHHEWITIEIPKVEIEEVLPGDVPGWDLPDQTAGRAYGDLWLFEKRTAVLLVPSVVAREDRNVLLNPDHPDSARIRHSRPRPVIWDERLLGK
jgi:RES domain-containing protein